MTYSLIKYNLFLIFMMGLPALNAQSYLGYLSDNFSGVHRVISNPADLAESPFKTDINLLGASMMLYNDYYAVKLSETLKGNYDFADNAVKSASNSNTFFGNLDVLGPSFSVNLGEKNTVAFFTRGRAYFNVNEINGKNFDNLTNEFHENLDYTINEGEFFAHANAWSEIGLSYATVIVGTERHLLKGGVSLKYLQGYANGYMFGSNVSVNYDADGITLPNNQTTGSIQSTGQITYGYSSDFQNYKFQRTGSGLGIDIGAIYEWTPLNANTYKLKIGWSIMDLGAINFENGSETTYDINSSIDQNDYENANGLEGILDDFYTEISSAKSKKAFLPAAFNLNADYRLGHKLYFNLNTSFSLSQRSNVNKASILNIVTLTPRFQSKGFGVYFPISLLPNSGLQWGGGFRAGPFYIGSSSILSILAGDVTKYADLFAGLKLSIFKNK